MGRSLCACLPAGAPIHPHRGEGGLNSREEEVAKKMRPNAKKIMDHANGRSRPKRA